MIRILLIIILVLVIVHLLAPILFLSMFSLMAYTLVSIN
jgi:hypothetical protein